MNTVRISPAIILAVALLCGLPGAGWTAAEAELPPEETLPEDALPEDALKETVFPSEAVLTLEEAVRIALEGNPDLAEMQARYEAMAAIPSQVGTLPDPMLSFNALNFPTDTFNYRQEAMTQLQLGISQQIPFPGKLALKEEAAEFEAVAAQHSVEETRLLLMRDVRVGWWTLFFLDRALEIVERNQDLLRQFVEIAKTKYEVGDGLQQDVLLAQVELSKLLEQEIGLTGARRTESAKLNRLMNRPADAPLKVPETVAMTFPKVAPDAELFRRGELSRPLLQSQRSRIQAARSRVLLAKKDYYPDFSLGAVYGARGGENPGGQGDRADFLTLRFGLNLPIYQDRKRAKAVSQRESELSGARYALADEINAMQSEVSQSQAIFIQARDQFRLFETGIIPQARQTVESMLAGYQVSEVDFLNLVRSQITLYNYETLYWQSLAVANQALARLRAAVGEEDIGG